MVRSDSLSSTIRMSATEGPCASVGRRDGGAVRPVGSPRGPGWRRPGPSAPRGARASACLSAVAHLGLLVRAVAARGAVDEGRAHRVELRAQRPDPGLELSTRACAWVDGIDDRAEARRVGVHHGRRGRLDAGGPRTPAPRPRPRRRTRIRASPADGPRRGRRPSGPSRLRLAAPPPASPSSPARAPRRRPGPGRRRGGPGQEQTERSRSSERSWLPPRAPRAGRRGRRSPSRPGRWAPAARRPGRPPPPRPAGRTARGRSPSGARSIGAFGSALSPSCRTASASSFFPCSTRLSESSARVAVASGRQPQDLAVRGGGLGPFARAGRASSPAPAAHRVVRPQLHRRLQVGRGLRVVARCDRAAVRARSGHCRVRGSRPGTPRTGAPPPRPARRRRANARTATWNRGSRRAASARHAGPPHGRRLRSSASA